MALPKLDVPIYELNLPLLKKKVKYRPFLVKEEKLLLMAMESEDEKEVVSTIKQIINNCCLDELDVDMLPILDLEFFFLNLRAKSISEVSELQYKCNNKIKDDAGEEKSCNNVVKIDFNILDVKPVIDKEHTNKIELTPKMGIVMKYPNFKTVESVEQTTEIETLMKIIIECIDFIYDEDNIYYKKDVDFKELQEFVENMSREQFAKIQKFFDTMPKLKKEVEFKCTKCGYKEKIEVEGIQNFFA